MKFYPRILNQDQLFLLKNLGFLKKKNFYLAGGTGLALQLGHRTSIDLDFYTQKPFEAEKITSLFTTKSLQIKIIGVAEGTLMGRFKKTAFSLFYHPYKLLKPLVPFEQVSLASIEDIAAMKIVAIVQRGTKRDFIDIYYLLQKYSLTELISFVLRKYPAYQEMLILRALIYFEDAEKETQKRAIRVFDKDFSWKKAKEEIFSAVREYQLRMIK